MNLIKKEKMISTLVFAGGGMRCLSYVGALQELRDSLGFDFGAKNPKVKVCAGVSIGCLFALMIAVGFNVVEITFFASVLKQSDVLNIDYTRLFNNELSIDDASKLKSVIEKIFFMKCLPTTLTFIQLFEKSQIYHYIFMCQM